MDYRKYNEIVQGWIEIVQENCDRDAELTLKYSENIIFIRGFYVFGSIL